MIPLLQIFGDTVRQVRKGRGLSQEALAELCNLHRTYIGGIETGKRNIGLLNLLRLAQALDVPASELLRGFDKVAVAEVLGEEHA